MICYENEFYECGCRFIHGEGENAGTRYILSKRNRCKQSYAKASRRVTVTINTNPACGTFDMEDPWDVGGCHVSLWIRYYCPRVHQSLSGLSSLAYNPRCNPAVLCRLLLPNLSPQSNSHCLILWQVTSYLMQSLAPVDLYLT